MASKPKRPPIRIGTKLWRRYNSLTHVVAGETSRSWLLTWDGRDAWIPMVKLRKRKLPDGWMLDEQEWIDWKFAAKHARTIARVVERATGSQLRQIAEIIGWKEDGK